jgi:hypothetical protein
MRQLGYVEGSDVRFEFRFADGYLDRLPDLANQLVRLNPRVIVSTPLPAHLAARKAMTTVSESYDMIRFAENLSSPLYRLRKSRVKSAIDLG